ncbi:hypothetical protein AMATHDRAFT_146880 [Amanita thiersii Skay4041]|uniref:Matrin-type domain-containing protein n=1 Tax=Amanita thiersii Skay4041 TaxID=703135 RepID=A0A2A9NQ21_9AGAR|nr:hypothetical protein AMATHDRAFT_146880 [Amanita thiersii Skay4041]
MSEYWVSKKKYFCKYCEIYIADDAPSRQQHENGLRHQGNRERFIRNIYKTSEKKKKDLEEEKRELARVDQAAQAAFVQDVSAGYARPQFSSASSSTSASKKPAPKPSNPYANYSTAESLGYSDPDVEHAAAEAERRRTQGIAGEWQVVTPTTPPLPSSATDADDQKATENILEIPEKRPADTLGDDDARHYKLRKKTTTGLGEIYDPGVIKVKLKKDEPATPPTETKAEEDHGLLSGVKVEDNQSKSGESLKWLKVQWKPASWAPTAETKNGVDVSPRNPVASSDIEPQNPPNASGELPTKNEAEETKVKEEDLSVKSEDLVSLKSTAPSESTGLFKKRRAPASVNSGRGRWR